jgi:hypothetical protein
MSELKVHKIGDLCFDFKMGKDVGIDFYLKSEADKVLADLEESHKKEVGQLLIEIAGLKADYKEACDRLQTANLIKDEQLAATRHSKYKRCLNKAEWCEELCARYDVLQERTGFSWRREIDFYFRWSQRWLELAEKFKETK